MAAGANLYNARLGARRVGGRQDVRPGCGRAGQEPLETFLDLRVAYGNDLRWNPVVANANPLHLRHHSAQ